MPRATTLRALTSDDRCDVAELLNRYGKIFVDRDAKLVLLELWFTLPYNRTATPADHTQALGHLNRFRALVGSTNTHRFVRSAHKKFADRYQWKTRGALALAILTETYHLLCGHHQRRVAYVVKTLSKTRQVKLSPLPAIIAADPPPRARSGSYRAGQTT